MKSNYLLLLICMFFTAACNDDKEVNTGTNENKSSNEIKTEVTQNGLPDLQSPGFSDPAVNQYFTNYVVYLKKIIPAIRNKNEAEAMRLFNEEGVKFDDMNDEESKAKAEPGGEQKFNTWLMEIYPYQKEVVGSEYYQKWFKNYDFKTSHQKK